MKNEVIRRAYDSVLPDGEARARMLRNILSEASNARPERIEFQMKKRSIKKSAIIILAAALALALSVGALAYATDLFGFRALARPEPEGGYAENSGVLEGQSVISLTQPQDVPDEVEAKYDTAIAEKLETNRLAWNEWIEWANSTDSLSKEFNAIEEKYHLDDWDSVRTEKNEDGSATFECYTYYGDRTKYDADAFKLEATVVMPSEDYQRYLELEALMGAATIYDSGYDFNYCIGSDEQKAKLEEIAEKYGLKLRGNITLMWSSETSGWTGEDCYTNEELVEILSGAACSGRLFNDTPAGYDKVYYYDEGTFSVVWIADLPDGGQAECYGYNSMYGTLSSGSELSWAEDIDSFTTRTHVCPDGTEVTILSNGSDGAYIYVYLENSFFAEHITNESLIMNGTDALTDADLDYIADNINYSVIGK